MNAPIKLRSKGLHTFFDVNDPSREFDSDDLQWKCDKCKVYNEPNEDCDCGRKAPMKYEFVDRPKTPSPDPGAKRRMKQVLHQMRARVPLSSVILSIADSMNKN